LPPERHTKHPLGCHRPRISDRIVFEKLVQVLVFGCAYEKKADRSCSATTLRRRRDEWIELGLLEALRERALEVWLAFLEVNIIIRRLIHERWIRYRWEGRPRRRP
jgi:transposase